MPVDISHYQQVSRVAGSLQTAGKTVHLSKSGNDLVLRGSGFWGRMVSWFKGFRAANHAAVKQSFIEALTSQYGRGVTNQVASEYRLNDANCTKKALTSRDVFLVFARADQCSEIESERQATGEKNTLLASQYTVSPESFSDTDFQSADHKFSQILSKVIKNGEEGHTVDAQKVFNPEELESTGKEIKKRILKKGDGGRHQVKEKEADDIAEQVLREAVVEKYKRKILDKYLIPENLSQDSNESLKLVSQMNRQRDEPNLDLTKLPKATVDAINKEIEADIIGEMYQADPDKPVLLSEDRVAEIAGKNIRMLATVLETVNKLDSPALNSMTVPQLKRVYEARMKIQPHLEVIGDADTVSEKELKTAINGYIDVLGTLGTTEDDESLETEKAQCLLMMMAQQGEENDAVMEKLYRAITEPGVFNSYLKTMHHYRSSVLIEKLQVAHDDSYQASEQRSNTFCRWTSALGVALAERLKQPQGVEEVMEQNGNLPSPLTIDDQMLTLMRNTGIKVPAPDRFNQEGSGTFSDEAMKHMEKKMASGVINDVKDDISRQFLLDMGVRATAYFNGEKVEADNVVDTLKEFCTDETGKLNRDMLFAVSQMHQGVFGSAYSVLVKEQMTPVHGLFSGGSKLICHFNKDTDGNVLVKAISKKMNAEVFTSVHSGDIFLDETRSEFEVGLELRLNKDQFTADRNRYVPPEVINATYRYSLYTKDE